MESPLSAFLMFWAGVLAGGAACLVLACALVI